MKTLEELNVLDNFMFNAIATDPEISVLFLYFNTSGTKGGTEAIKQLLSYLKDSKMENVTNESTAQIHNYVQIK